MVHRYSKIDFTNFSSALIMGETNGNSEISNGSGKSTIFTGIFYALSGEAPTSTIQKIIRIGANKAMVTFRFQIRGEIYEIIRSRTKTVGEIELRQLVNGNWVDLTQMRKKDGQLLINEVLGYSPETFNQAAYLSQRSLDALVKSSRTGKEKLELLRQVFNLIIYSKLEKLAKDRVSEYNRSIQNFKQIIEILGEPTVILEKTETEVLGVKKSLELLDEQRAKLEEELNQTQSLVMALADAAGDNVSLLLRQKELKDQAHTFSQLLKKTEDSKKNLNIESLLSEKSSKTQLLKNKKQIVEVKVDLESLNQLYEANVAELMKLKIEEQKNHNFLTYHSHQLPSDAKCGACQREITSDYRTHYEETHRQELPKYQAIASELATTSKKLVQERVEIQQQIAEATKQVTAQKVAQAEIPMLEERIGQLEQQILQKQESLVSLEEQILKYQKTLQEYNSQLTQLEESLLEPQKKLEAHTAAQAKFRQKQEEMKALASKVQTQLTQLGVLEERKYQKTLDLNKQNETKKELATAQESFKLYSEVASACASTGIPNMVIYSMLDDFQVKLNEVLAKIRPNFEAFFQVTKTKKGIDEDAFDIVFRLDGVDLDLSQISGGQEFMVRLALKIALTELLKSRLGLEIGMLCLDEVDKEMDSAASKQLFRLIKELEKDYLVLVITHKDSLKSNFKYVILVQNAGIQEGATIKVMNA